MIVLSYLMNKRVPMISRISHFRLLQRSLISLFLDSSNNTSTRDFLVAQFLLVKYVFLACLLAHLCATFASSFLLHAWSCIFTLTKCFKAATRCWQLLSSLLNHVGYWAFVHFSPLIHNLCNKFCELQKFFQYSL